ncbi:MAG: right-handed parallel beta-helix repeat-containing protein [Bacteroidota bacterium]
MSGSLELYPASVLKLRTFLLLGMVYFLPTLCLGSTYYLSPSGDDAYSGLSPSAAWATVAHLNTQPISPGDSILFEGGFTYDAQLRFAPPRVGNPQNPIVISSYGGGRATLDGGNGYGILIFNGAGFKISNLDLIGSGLDENKSPGIHLDTDTTDEIFFSYLELDSLDISGFTEGGVLVETSNMASSVKAGYDDIRITYTHLHHNGDAGINIEGRLQSSGYTHKNIYVAHCVANDNYGIKDKNWNNTGNGIVIGNADTVLIEYCVAYHNGRENRFAYGGPVGIWYWDTRQGVIQFCESHHNESASIDGGGFDLDGGCVESIIQYCYSHDNEGAGYLAAGFYGSRPIKDCVFRFNISQNDGREAYYGSFHFWKASVATIDGFDVYNNTVYSKDPDGSVNAIVKVDASDIQGLRFFNNCFISEDGSPFVTHGSLGSIGSTLFSHNLYYTRSLASIDYDGITYGDIASWQAGTGQEMDGVLSTALTVDPLLKDVGAGPTVNNTAGINMIEAYKPLSGSPLMNSGVNLLGMGIDPGMNDFHLSPISPAIYKGIGSSASALPFDLRVLTWQLHQNSSGFQIFVSDEKLENAVSNLWVEAMLPNSQSYQKIGELEGSSNVALSYTYFPHASGRYRFRIHGKYLDGEEWYSDIKSSVWKGAEKVYLSQIGSHRFQIHGLMANEVTQLKLVDIHGRGIDGLSSDDNLRIELPSYVSPGLYFIQVYAAGRRHLLRILI